VKFPQTLLRREVPTERPTGPGGNHSIFFWNTNFPQQVSMARTLAMDCSFLRDTSGLPSVFGFDVAVNGIVQALLRESTYERFIFFHPPGQPAPVDLHSRVRAGAELRLEPTTRIQSAIRNGDITAWFQPDTVTEPVNYRTAFSRAPFPFSTMIHIAWSPRLIKTQFLWLLLDGFGPCDSFICTSRAVREVVRNTLDYIEEEMNASTGAKLRYQGRLDVLPLGVDTDRFAPLPKAEVRRELGWPEDAFFILWLGRFSVVDKTDLLPALRVFRRLVQANPGRQLRFVLAGNDRRDIPFVPSMHEFIATMGLTENVRILENAPQETRHKLFAAADVFTSPIDNLQETFGITPLEAMAAGTPQIVSDWDGYRDTVVDGVTGYRIPTYWSNCDGDDQTDYGIGGFGYQGFLFSQTVAIDLREYEAAIQRLIDDPGLLKAMSVASRERATHLFGWKPVIQAYEELWTELTDTAQRLSSSDLPSAPFVRSKVCRRFAPFPTAILDGSESIRISEDGRRLIAGRDPFPWHSPLEKNLINAEAMLSFLASVEQVPGTIEDAVEQLTGKNSKHRPAMLRMVMWGFKHGLLECSVSAQADPVPGFAGVAHKQSVG
jgi:glycosyltransferase involved in cell wall biosynthesis